MTRIITSVLLLLLSAAGAARADTIKLATIAPQDSPYYEVLRDLGAAWARASGGRVELRIYAGGVAGDEDDVIRKMRIGQLQASAMSGGGLVDIVPELQVLQMPMMFRSDAERDYVADRIHPEIAALLEKRGFKVLGWSSAGWLQFFTQSPVLTPDDLRPLAVFTWAGNNSVIAAWKAAGFRPVAMPATEIMTGLQSGLINAIAVPPLPALAQQWFGLARHMTGLNWAALEGAIFVTRSAWDAVPAAARPQMEQAAQQACRTLAGSMRRLSEAAVEVMRKHGLAVHQVTPAQRALWEAAVQPHYAVIAGGAGPPALLARVRALRDEYRAAHPGE
jgi:TRAP-type C4-dicarboxylate transport system substrate-binding protein